MLTGSSTAEPPAVNRQDAGSSPALSATSPPRSTDDVRWRQLRDEKKELLRQLTNAKHALKVERQHRPTGPRIEQKPLAGHWEIVVPSKRLVVYRVTLRGAVNYLLKALTPPSTRK